MYIHTHCKQYIVISKTVAVYLQRVVTDCHADCFLRIFTGLVYMRQRHIAGNGLGFKSSWKFMRHALLTAPSLRDGAII